jgi:hypothetical protein
MNKANPSMKTADDYISETSLRELASGILEQVGQDLRRFHGTTSAVERELYHDAHRWVLSDDSAWPFSFLNVCRLLKLAREILRQDLLGDASLGLFGYLTRRGARAARSLQMFSNRVFTKNRRPTGADPVPLTHVPMA